MMERFRYRGRMRLWGRELNKPEGAGSEASSGEAVADVLRLAAERINEIVDAAERAASEINAAASERLAGSDAKDSQITRERIVAELSQSLVDRASDLRAEAGALADVLSRATERLAAQASATREPAEQAQAVAKPSQRQEPAPEPTQVRPAEGLRSPDLSARVSERFSERPGTEEQAPSGKRVPFKRRARSQRPKPDAKRPSNDGLRLLATQMAVAGSTREEIEDRLRTEFGVEDSSAIFGGLQVPGSRL